MEKENYPYSEVKKENRNRIFNRIREVGSISRPALARDLELSLPTVSQNLSELVELGYICETGSIGHTGGRRAKVYSIEAKSKAAIGIDLTKNRISVIAANLNGEIVCQDEENIPFCNSEEYWKILGKLAIDTVNQLKMEPSNILGVGIAVPALVSENHESIFYGKILGITDLTVRQIGKYIPYPCRLYNDADAAGYAEISSNQGLSDAFYIGLNNNIGGAVLIDHTVYKGQSPRSGEIGHITIIPNGKPCYCGQRGCMESYCNAELLSAACDGSLERFFEHLNKHDKKCVAIWDEYLECLSIAVNNISMLFDCDIILGGYVGGYMEPWLEDLRQRVLRRNPFDKTADFLRVCNVRQAALALGSALPFIHEFCKSL